MDVGAGVGVVAVIGEGVAVVADGVSTAAGVAVGGRSSSQAESAATATEHSSATKMREQIVIPPIQTAFESVPIQETELPQPGCTIFGAQGADDVPNDRITAYGCAASRSIAGLGPGMHARKPICAIVKASSRRGAPALRMRSLRTDGQHSVQHSLQ